MRYLFVFATTLLGCLIGLFYGLATIPKNSGFSGPAEVLMYGLLIGIVAFVLSLVINRKIQDHIRKKVTIAFLVLSLIPIGWLIYRFQTNRSHDQLEPLTPNRAVTPVSYMLEDKMGLGMMKPDFINKNVLYFYSSPNLEKGIGEHTPFDSLKFSLTDHSYEITYAPPWFFPEHMKMDYEILYFKALNTTRDWLQVEVNKQNGRSVWIDANAVELLYWPEFLLNINSIEIINRIDNPLRARPVDHAAPWQGTTYELMVPEMINENWLKVILYDSNMNKVGEAWLRWHDNQKLLISYSLLS